MTTTQVTTDLHFLDFTENTNIKKFKFSCCFNLIQKELNSVVTEYGDSDGNLDYNAFMKILHVLTKCQKDKSNYMILLQLYTTNIMFLVFFFVFNCNFRIISAKLIPLTKLPKPSNSSLTLVRYFINILNHKNLNNLNFTFL